MMNLKLLPLSDELIINIDKIVSIRREDTIEIEDGENVLFGSICTFEDGEELILSSIDTDQIFDHTFEQLELTKKLAEKLA